MFQLRLPMGSSRYGTIGSNQMLETLKCCAIDAVDQYAAQINYWLHSIHCTALLPHPLKYFHTQDEVSSSSSPSPLLSPSLPSCSVGLCCARPCCVGSCSNGSLLVSSCIPINGRHGFSNSWGGSSLKLSCTCMGKAQSNVSSTATHLTLALIH